MKLGIFGGSFNPIHIGHLILAQEALMQFELDKILFIPAAKPPHKDLSDIIEPEHRYRMVELAIKNNPDFEISDMEIRRQGLSYTIDTLLELKSKYPDKTEFYLLVGLDSMNEFYSWKQADKLMELCYFLCAPRRGYPWDNIDSGLKKKVKLIDSPMIDIAASTIRQRIASNQSVRYWLPEPVYQYIIDQKLYYQPVGLKP